MTKISFTEVASRLGIHRATARTRVVQGQIPGHYQPYPGRHACDREVFEAWFDKRAKTLKRFKELQGQRS